MCARQSQGLWPFVPRLLLTTEHGAPLPPCVSLQFTQDGVASVTDALQTLRQQRSTMCSGPGPSPASQAVYSTHSRSTYRAAASTSVRPAGPPVPDVLQAYLRMRP